jgi:hypothetical protein
MNRDTESTPKSADCPAEGESVRNHHCRERLPRRDDRGDIPHGVEVLVKKAAVAPDFRQSFWKNAPSLHRIGLKVNGGGSC